MNNKQSSIELFIDQLEEKGKAYEETVGVRTVNICIDVSEYMELKQQAKAMHREEINDAYWLGYGDHQTQDIHDLDEIFEYIFGGNNEQN